jgi:hypothetical protein
VKNNYILIDTDIDIGKLNDLITISRNLNQRIETVGRVKLIRFKNGKSIAAIVDEFSPYHIKIGDYVDASTSKNTKFTKTDSKNEINKRINNIVQKIINSHKKLESYKYRNTIAVLDFSSESKEAQEKKIGYAASELLTTKLSGIDIFNVLERKRLSQITTEIALGMSGLINEETAAQAGKIVVLFS